MFKQNCIAEVKKFNSLKLKKSFSAHKLIGVQEITKYLDKNFELYETIGDRKILKRKE